MRKITCSQIFYRSRVLLLNRNLSLNLHSMSISLWQELQKSRFKDRATAVLSWRNCDSTWV